MRFLLLFSATELAIQSSFEFEVPRPQVCFVPSSVAMLRRLRFAGKKGLGYGTAVQDFGKWVFNRFFRFRNVLSRLRLAISHRGSNLVEVSKLRQSDSAPISVVVASSDDAKIVRSIISTKVTTTLYDQSLSLLMI